MAGCMTCQIIALYSLKGAVLLFYFDFMKFMLMFNGFLLHNIDLDAHGVFKFSIMQVVWMISICNMSYYWWICA